eukprot:g25753.t1
MDIQSLYPCIPQADGLKALCYFLSRRPDQSPSTDTLIRLTELVLTLNNFSFNSSHFLQTKGVAMGTLMGPSYACLFVGYVEYSCSYTGPIPQLFLRYINDCIGAALCSHEELEQFINFTKTFYANLKYTWTISDTSLLPGPLCLHLWDRALHDSLVRSTLPTNSTTPRTFPCNCRKFSTCPYTSPLTSIQGIKQNIHIRQRFTCTSSNLIYCICCSRCGLLYIGETKHRLGDRFVEHLHSAHDKRQHRQVDNDFNSPSHSLDAMSILGLFQCHNDTTHKLEEQYLIFCFRGQQPDGLNIEFA